MRKSEILMILVTLDIFDCLNNVLARPSSSTNLFVIYKNYAAFVLLLFMKAY